MQALPGSSAVERLTEAEEAKAPSFDHVNQNVAGSIPALAAKFIQRECKHHGLTTYVYTSEKKYRCKRCRSEAVSFRRKKVMLEIKTMFGGKCTECGYNKCLEALDFHHLDPEKKEFEVNSALTISKARMVEEAKKCILLCANCHRELHARERCIEEVENSTGT